MEVNFAMNGGSLQTRRGGDNAVANFRCEGACIFTLPKIYDLRKRIAEPRCVWSLSYTKLKYPLNISSRRASRDIGTDVTMQAKKAVHVPDHRLPFVLTASAAAVSDDFCNVCRRIMTTGG